MMRSMRKLAKKEEQVKHIWLVNSKLLCEAWEKLASHRGIGVQLAQEQYYCDCMGLTPAQIEAIPRDQKTFIR